MPFKFLDKVRCIASSHSISKDADHALPCFVDHLDWSPAVQHDAFSIQETDETALIHMGDKAQGIPGTEEEAG